MKTINNTIHHLISNLISTLTPSSITDRNMPRLIPVRVITKAYRDNK